MQSPFIFQQLHGDLFILDNEQKQVVNSKLHLISHIKDDIRSKIVLDAFKEIIFQDFKEFSYILNLFTVYFAKL